MNRIKYLFLRLLCLPANIVISLPAFVVLQLFLGERWEWRRGTAVIFLKEDMPKWYEGWGGTTLGHVIMARQYEDEIQQEKLILHEFVHVEQFEVGCLFGAVMGLAAWLLFPLIGHWAPLLVSASSAVLFTGCAMVTAWLRGEGLYRGSSMEEAAYALAGAWEHDKRHPPDAQG